MDRMPRFAEIFGRARLLRIHAKVLHLAQRSKKMPKGHGTPPCKKVEGNGDAHLWCAIIDVETLPVQVGFASDRRPRF